MNYLGWFHLSYSYHLFKFCSKSKQNVNMTKFLLMIFIYWIKINHLNLIYIIKISLQSVKLFLGAVGE